MMRVASRLAFLLAAAAFSPESPHARAHDSATTATRPNTVLLMTHRRDAGVRAVLDHLAASSASPSSLRVVVAQSAELRRRGGAADSVPSSAPHSESGDDPLSGDGGSALAWIGVGEEGGPTHPDPYVSATAAVLASYASTFGRVEHVVTPYVRGDGSYSRDARAFGTKRNALVNLLTGLTAAFGPGGLQRQGVPVNSSWGSSEGAADAATASAAGAAAAGAAPATGGDEDVGEVSDTPQLSTTAADGSRDVLRRPRSAASDAEEGAAVARSSPPASPKPPRSQPSPSPPRRSFLTVPTEVLILEDDAVLSPDALEYFDSASRLMDLDRHLDFATASVQFRPNLVIGHADTDLISALRSRTPESTEVLIDRISGTPRTVFKTFAWMLSRRGWAGLRGLLEGMARASLPPPPPPPISSTADGEAHSSPSSSVAVAWRSIHPELSGCVWCNDYCYDHLVEWFLQGSPFLAPAVARATQAAGRGMTYAENAVDAIHAGRARRSNEFVTGWASMALVRFFPSPGLSSMAPMRPTAAAAAADDGDTAAAAAAAAGEPHLARSELILLVITEPLVTFLLLLLSVLSVFVAISLASCVQARLAARKTLKAH